MLVQDVPLPVSGGIRDSVTCVSADLRRPRSEVNSGARTNEEKRMGVVRARRTCQPPKGSRTYVLRIAIPIASSVAGLAAAAPSQPSRYLGLSLIGSHRDDHHRVYSYLPECRTSGVNYPRFLGYVEPDLE